MQTKNKFLLLFLFLFLLTSGVYAAYAWNSLPVEEDPLVHMPGTQPNQVSLESPTRCLNCHAGYNSAIEPGFNWQGSMMAQAARDFLFWSCLTVAAQDSIWAVGTPNAVDLCERCHFPEGWLEGRSDPPDVSAMTGTDYDGVHCDFCHRMYDPFFETTYAGTREGNDWLHYWDETNKSGTPSQLAAGGTYAEDMVQAASVVNFNGSDFFTNNLPPAGYTESGSGQFFVSANSAKRAPLADEVARHQVFYSRYHKSKYFCDTCHDVSNPVLANLGADPANLLPTEQNAANSYFHVERTFSEFMLSDYGQQGGAPGIGPFAPDLYETSDPNNNIRMCQDCHMRDVVGPAADKKGVLIRPNESVEHPNSGLPLHDLTGGNAWVSYVLASAVSGSPNYDPINDSLLNQGSSVLTLDLSQGEGIDPQALLAGVDRAKEQLQLAASFDNVSYNASNGALSFRVQNQTGHKLISGFPEGRRMFINIQAYQGGQLIYEANPYDVAAGTLKGLPYPYQPDPNDVLLAPEALQSGESYIDELVYEMHPTSSLTGETETFHFALATGRYKDNRIPPKGFRIQEANIRIVQPVWHGVDAPNYFTSAEYGGGYDDVSLTIIPGADQVVISLYYQTTSREYIEFLRDEINGTGNLTLTGTGAGGDPPYLIQNDPFFSQLNAWGDTIWDLWTHNMNVPGATPFLMTQVTTTGPPQAVCQVPSPALLSAEPSSNEVALNWTPATGATAYVVYYDQAGKAQLVADAALATTYTDKNLTNGLEYCYKVTASGLDDAGQSCESDFSNIFCATPNSPGQEQFAGVNQLESGRYEMTGKGKDKTTVFVLTEAFNQGDAVIFRAYVIEPATGTPLTNAVVDLAITGPETTIISSSASDAAGMAEVTWQTKAPGKRNQPGTTPGAYTVTVSNVSVAGYTWDGVGLSMTFEIQ